jgi:ketosteroid isomerase-like protein
MKVRSYGDTGIVMGRLTIKATWEGSDVGGEYAFTDTFVKQGGKWRTVASQVTRVES